MKTTSGDQRGSGFHMLRGSAWMVSLRWSMRLIGIISTIILARVLTPQDFGVVALAMIVVGLFEMLNLTGQSQAIVRHEAPTRDHYNSAWTISVLIGTFIAVGIFFAAPLTQYYFHEPRAVPVIQLLALRAFLGGLENVGTVDFSRDLRFDRYFIYNVCTKLFQFCLTVTLAFVLRNYWALVAGILAGQVTRTSLSYIMSPFRPRLSFSCAKEIWSFSIWTFVRAVASYLQTQVDNIAIGGIAGTGVMGRFTVAQDVAASPTQEVINPMISALFPVMSKCRSDPAELRRLYLRMLGWSAIICASTGVGVAMVSHDLVRVVLGAKWIAATPLVAWIAMSTAVAALLSGTTTLLDVEGMPHISARIQWARFAAFGAAIFGAAYLTHDVITIVAARLTVSALFVPSIIFYVRKRTGVHARDYIAVMWRPFAAAAAMALTIWSLNAALPFDGAFRLAIDIATGATCFAAVLLLLWDLSGRPQSAEQDILTLAGRIFARFTRVGVLPKTAD